MNRRDLVTSTAISGALCLLCSVSVLAQSSRVAVRDVAVVGMMADVGVPLLAGSDTATPWAFPGFGHHDELELLVEAGLTELGALRAATSVPARFLGASDSLGSVEEGKLADLVLLDANPLADITNTQRIRAVVADGRLYRRSDLDRHLDEAEASNRQAEEQE